MKRDKSVTKPKKMSKATKIATSIVVSLSVAGGIATGYYFGRDYFRPAFNYGQYDVDTLEDDIDALYLRYQKTDASLYLSTFEGYELVNIALKNYENEANNYSVVIGDVNAAGVTQTVRSFNIKNGIDLYSESISHSSLVKVAKRFYQSEEIVDVFAGSKIGVESASYSQENKESYGLDEFEEAYGKTFSRASIYIISSQTVLSQSVIDNGDSISIDIDLDPQKSVIRYVKQMSEMSGLSKPPTFDDIHITFTMDKSLTLLKSNIIEHYEVYKFGYHSSTGEMEETYHAGEYLKIPDLDETYAYTQED